MELDWKVVAIFLVVWMRASQARPQTSLEYKPNRPFYAGSKPVGVPDQLVPPQVPEDVPTIEKDTFSTASTLKSTTVIENRVQDTDIENNGSTEVSSSTTTDSTLDISSSTTSEDTTVSSANGPINDSSTSGSTAAESSTQSSTTSTESSTVVAEVATTVEPPPQSSLSTSKITTVQVLPSSTEAVTQVVPHSNTISDILYTSASKDKPQDDDKIESTTSAGSTSGTTGTTPSTGGTEMKNCDCTRQEIVITIRHVHEYAQPPPAVEGAADKTPPQWPITTQSILPQFNLFYDKWGAVPTTNHKHHRYYYYRPPY